MFPRDSIHNFSSKFLNILALNMPTSCIIVDLTLVVQALDSQVDFTLLATREGQELGEPGRSQGRAREKAARGGSQKDMFC